MYVEAYETQVINQSFLYMRCLVMFETAVCILFLFKLKWPKNKSFFIMMAFVNSFDIGALLNTCSILKDRGDFTGSSLPTSTTSREQCDGPIKLKYIHDFLA